MPVIKLESSDGVQFETDTKIAQCSGTIKSMLEFCSEDDEKDTVVPLQNVSSGILRHFLQWANHHKDDAPPIDDDEQMETRTDAPRTDDISEWDAGFLKKMDQGTLFQLLVAANYLDVKGLLVVTSTAIGNMIKGKTTEEIRTIFNIKNDFTSTEMEQDANTK